MKFPLIPKINHSLAGRNSFIKSCLIHNTSLILFHIFAALFTHETALYGTPKK